MTKFLAWWLIFFTDQSFLPTFFYRPTISTDFFFCRLRFSLFLSLCIKKQSASKIREYKGWVIFSLNSELIREICIFLYMYMLHFMNSTSTRFFIRFYKKLKELEIQFETKYTSKLISCSHTGSPNSIKNFLWMDEIGSMTEARTNDGLKNTFSPLSKAFSIT